MRPGTQTATFAAVKLHVDNWRWQGVPFYLRSGKAMSCGTTQLVIQFRQPPYMLFEGGPRDHRDSNRLVIQIQPAEGIQLHFYTKVPDAGMQLRMTDLNFRFREKFSGPMPEAYQRLLLDAINGDPSLFARSDEVEAAWQIVDSIQNGLGRSGTTAPGDLRTGRMGTGRIDRVDGSAGTLVVRHVSGAAVIREPNSIRLVRIPPQVIHQGSRRQSDDHKHDTQHGIGQRIHGFSVLREGFGQVAYDLRKFLLVGRQSLLDHPRHEGAGGVLGIRRRLVHLGRFMALGALRFEQALGNRGVVESRSTARDGQVFGGLFRSVATLQLIAQLLRGLLQLRGQGHQVRGHLPLLILVDGVQNCRAFGHAADGLTPGVRSARPGDHRPQVVTLDALPAEYLLSSPQRRLGNQPGTGRRVESCLDQERLHVAGNSPR